MSVLNSELEEAAVGTMMPVVTPDQVLAKNTAESVDKEFGALKMFSSMDGSDEEDEFDESAVIDNIKLKLKNLKHLEVSRKTFSLNKKEISETIKNINIVEKALIEKDKSFVPYSKLNRSLDKITVDEAKEIFKINITDKDPKSCHMVTFSDNKNPVMACVIVLDSSGKFSHYFNITGKYAKYYRYYYDSCRTKYLKSTVPNPKYWEKLAKDVEDNKPLKLEFVERDILHENGLDSVIYEDSKIEERTDYFTDEEFFGEAANIDDDIKDIIKKLNDKGYETLYSCSGHPSARLKSDGKRDGIKDKKLYSTAKIVFAKDYNFPSYPDGWEEKKLDDGNIGIYVKGPTFRIINGLPVDQFYNWKQKYMRHLEKWVDELPDKDELGKEEKSDEITESVDELLQDLMIDLA